MYLAEHHRESNPSWFIGLNQYVPPVEELNQNLDKRRTKITVEVKYVGDKYPHLSGLTLTIPQWCKKEEVKMVVTTVYKRYRLYPEKHKTIEEVLFDEPKYRIKFLGLSPQDKIEVDKRLDRGHTQKKISEDYGVSESVIYDFSKRPERLEKAK